MSAPLVIEGDYASRVRALVECATGGHPDCDLSERLDAAYDLAAMLESVLADADTEDRR